MKQFNGVYVVLAVILVLIVITLPRLDQGHPTCVVCKPSGTLAYWGECE